MDAPTARPRCLAHSSEHPVFVDLSAQWSRLNSGDESPVLVCEAVARWRLATPELADVTCLDDVLHALEDHPHTVTDALLIQSSCHGDHLAARVLIQAYLPLLLRVAGRSSSDLLEAIGALWVKLLQPPVDPSGQVTFSVYWAIRRLASPAPRPNQRHEYPVAGDTFLLDDHEACHQLDHSDPTVDRLASASTLEQIAETKVVSRDDLDLLMRIYGRQEPVAAVAIEQGVTPAAIRKRCSRARRAIIDSTLAQSAA